MSSTHASPDVDDTTRFRAATIESALAEARAELGDVEIVEANRIRRGGVGGFFATDLGVELVVRPPAASESRLRREQGHAEEFIDTAASAGALPRTTASRAVNDGRWPPFYDRVREESAPAGPITAGLERLLSTAAATEQAANDGGGGRTADRTFADHLARQESQDEPSARRESSAGSADLPRSTRQSRTERARPHRERVEPQAAPVGRSAAAEAEDVVDTEQPDERIPAPVHLASPQRDADQTAVAASTETNLDATPAPEPRPAAEPRPSAGSAPAEAAPVESIPVDSAPAEAAPVETTPSEPQPEAPRATTRRTTSSSRDPWRKSIDLAAGAVGRLVEQLSDVSPVDGSRMHTLSRLTVSVTTPDGAVIDLSAELEGDQ